MSARGDAVLNHEEGHEGHEGTKSRSTVGVRSTPARETRRAYRQTAPGTKQRLVCTLVLSREAAFRGPSNGFAIAAIVPRHHSFPLSVFVTFVTFVTFVVQTNFVFFVAIIRRAQRRPPHARQWRAHPQCNQEYRSPESHFPSRTCPGSTRGVARSRLHVEGDPLRTEGSGA